MKILKLCDNCGEEFELKDIGYSHGGTRLTSNFEDCPHCGTRNDTWIQIVSEEKLLKHGK